MSSAISEAIILAGGLGTRLREAVPELPKCMAPVAGRAFIDYVIDYALAQGIERLILALGYRARDIEAHIAAAYPHIPVVISTEEAPLGTGGAIQAACQKAAAENLLVLNGDTLFRYHLPQLQAVHLQHAAHCTLCLKPMRHFNRYGLVETDAAGKICLFKEKQYYEHGLINAGVYALNVPALLERRLPQKFSFEKDYLEAFAPEGYMYGAVQDAYFIDIGIPEDYNRAQAEFSIQNS